MRRTNALLLFALCLLASAPAAPADAGTVSILEQETGPKLGVATVEFRAAPGEDNRLTIAVTGASGEVLDLSVQDLGAGLEAGAGCTGGGPPGAVAHCRVQEPRTPEIRSCGRFLACPPDGESWGGRMSVDLGDGENAFDGSSFTQRFDGRFDMTVSSGPGGDRITTGSGEDLIDPGAGADEVHGGNGFDRVETTPAPDGSDLYDLGLDGMHLNEVSYRLRSLPVVMRQGQAGAEGEGDVLIGVDTVTGGGGDDFLAAAPGQVLLRGGPGADVLHGGPGSDLIRGGSGRDSLSGGRGEDRLFGEDGADRLRGGKGSDVDDCGPGNDLLIAGRGDRRPKRCERVLPPLGDRRTLVRPGLLGS